MLATLNDILPAARREKRAVGAFNIGNYETAIAIVRAAEELQLPVIVQVFSRLVDHGHAGALGALVRHLAEKATVPVVLHLDHGSSLEQVRIALDAGFTSVMLDASKLPYAENVALVKEAVRLAHAAGATAEGEIGHVPMTGSTMAVSDPDETLRFYEETQVDALAVSIGTVHGFYKAEPNIRVDLCAKLAEVIPVPLVLHGGSGTPREKVRAVIRNGIAKINVATEYLYEFQMATKERVNECGDKFVSTDILMAPVVDRCYEFIRDDLAFFAGR